MNVEQKLFHSLDDIIKNEGPQANRIGNRRPINQGKLVKGVDNTDDIFRKRKKKFKGRRNNTFRTQGGGRSITSQLVLGPKFIKVNRRWDGSRRHILNGAMIAIPRFFGRQSGGRHNLINERSKYINKTYYQRKRPRVNLTGIIPSRRLGNHFSPVGPQNLRRQQAVTSLSRRMLAASQRSQTNSRGTYYFHGSWDRRGGYRNPTRLDDIKITASLDSVATPLQAHIIDIGTTNAAPSPVPSSSNWNKNNIRPNLSSRFS